MEQLSSLKADNDELEAISTHLAEALADQLSRAFWEEHQPTVPISWRRFIGSRWPWLRKRFGGRRSAEAIAELEQIRLIESSSLFQPAWYLKQNADVARAGIHPAAHYLHSGVQEGRDPSPDFSTSDYFARDPEPDDHDHDPLVRFLQSQPAPHVR